MENYSIREWLEKYNNGDFDLNDRTTQIKAGWYDWFCDDEDLAEKTIELANRVKDIVKSPKIDLDKTYVWFKNNCPCYGDEELYDDFRFASLETNDTLYTIVPRNPFGNSEVWGIDNNFAEALVEGDWSDIVSFFFPV